MTSFAQAFCVSDVHVRFAGLFDSHVPERGECLVYMGPYVRLFGVMCALI